MLTGPRQELFQTAPTKHCKGIGYRSISVRFHTRPLSAEGSRRKSGRFHVAGAIDAIYIALDPITALHEVETLYRVATGMAAQPSNPRTLFSIHYDLPRTLDLRDAITREHLGYTLDTILSNWRPLTPDAPTQTLGQHAHRAGIQAILYPSYRNQQGGANLVIFPENLKQEPTGTLRVHDSDGRLNHTLP